MDDNWNVVGRDNENGDDDADEDEAASMMTSINDSTSISSISIDASEAAVGRLTESGKRARESFQMMMKDDEPSIR